MNIQDKIRGLNTLTAGEIIGIVDLLIGCSRLKKEDTPLVGYGVNSYRKIEARLGIGGDMEVRVTFSKSTDDETEVAAFLIDDKIDDIMIMPVSSATFSKEYVKALGLTLDYSTFDQHLRKIYRYFSEKLLLWNWNLSRDPFPINKALSTDWSMIDEETLNNYQ